MIKQRRLPIKLIKHYLLRSTLTFAVISVGLVFSARYFILNTFSAQRDLLASFAEVEDYLIGLGWTLFLVLLAYSAWTAQVYFRPLGRLIGPSPNDDDFSSADPGEWGELERRLERMQTDLSEKTKRLERERKELRSLLDAAPDPILAIDRSQRDLFYNDRFAQAFHLSEDAKKKSHLLTDLFRSPDVLMAYRSVLETGGPYFRDLVLSAPKSERTLHFSLAVSPLRDDEKDDVYGAIGVFRDISAQKSAEQVRIEFVANASHELRTPLTSIKGYLETVRSDLQSEQNVESLQHLAIIARNVDRLMALVTDLLDLSTLESGAPLKITPVYLHELTDSVMRQLEPKRAEKNLSVKIQIEAESLHADHRRVEQVLSNLLVNAIKYIPANETIEILWRLDPGSNDVLLSVRDTGPGIAPEHQARLFERFYRVDQGRARDQGGTGLGLAIVKHIMINHGGSVDLRSAPGQGAEFICRFPQASEPKS